MTRKGSPEQGALVCRGTDHFSFEIPADQPPRSGPDLGLHAGHAMASGMSQALVNPPGLPASADTGTADIAGANAAQNTALSPAQPQQQQQLLQLQQMAADAGLLLVPGVQTSTQLLMHTPARSQHDQQLLQQGQLQQRSPQPYEGGYPRPNPQQGFPAPPQHEYHALCANTSSWQISPGGNAQQQQGVPIQAQHGISASWNSSPSFPAAQPMAGHQPGHAQQFLSASPSQWQSSPGLHAQLQQQQQQSRLPSWAQQALQQPRAIANSPGYGTSDSSFAQHSSSMFPLESAALGASMQHQHLHREAHQQSQLQQQQQPSVGGSATMHSLAMFAGPSGIQQTSEGQHLSQDNAVPTSVSLNAAYAAQPRIALSQAWETSAHEQGQQAQASVAGWLSGQQPGLNTSDARAIGQGPDLEQGNLQGQGGLGGSEGSRNASSWQHPHGGESTVIAAPGCACQQSVLAVLHVHVSQLLLLLLQMPAVLHKQCLLC